MRRLSVLNPETVSRTVPRVRSARSLSLLFLHFSPLPPHLPLLSRSDSHERGRERNYLLSLRPFGTDRILFAFFSRVYFSRIPKTKEGTKERRNVHPTVNDFGEYIWWERKRFESIVHIRPCTIGIAQIHLGDWSYK